eukprot:6188299-Pleurochrysis_carterae.AAC.3
MPHRVRAPSQLPFGASVGIASAGRALASAGGRAARVAQRRRLGAAHAAAARLDRAQPRRHRTLQLAAASDAAAHRH